MGNESLMLGVADKRPDPTDLMNQLDAQCVGWCEAHTTEPPNLSFVEKHDPISRRFGPTDCAAHG